MIDSNETGDDADRRATRRVNYDPSTGAAPSEALVLALADLADDDPMALDPLYETMDPDIIDDFVTSGGRPDVDGRLEFTYEGWEVRVHASGLFELTPDG